MEAIFIKIASIGWYIFEKCFPHFPPQKEAGEPSPCFLKNKGDK
jgi:hypothetical protein